MKHLFIGCALAVVALLAAPTANAQVTLVKSVVANGGGPMTSSTYTLNGTVGQPAIGLVTNTTYTHGIGFWYPTDNIGGVEDDATTGYASGGNVLYQNFPNPFSTTTVIRFTLAQRSAVVVKVFNMPGQEVAVVADGTYEAGEHRVELSKPLPSGTYFYQLQAGTTVLRRQMVVAK